MLYQLYSITDDGFEMSRGYFASEEDADNALDNLCERLPFGYHDIREHETRD